LNLHPFTTRKKDEGISMSSQRASNQFPPCSPAIQDGEFSKQDIWWGVHADRGTDPSSSVGLIRVGGRNGRLRTIVHVYARQDAECAPPMIAARNCVFGRMPAGSRRWRMRPRTNVRGTRVRSLARRDESFRCARPQLSDTLLNRRAVSMLVNALSLAAIAFSLA
jgi:hypothetical protein